MVFFLVIGILYPFSSYHTVIEFGKIADSTGSMIRYHICFTKVLCSNNRSLRFSVHSLIGVHFFNYIFKEIALWQNIVLIAVKLWIGAIANDTQ